MHVTTCDKIHQFKYSHSLQLLQHSLSHDPTSYISTACTGHFITKSVKHTLCDDTEYIFCTY